MSGRRPVDVTGRIRKRRRQLLVRRLVWSLVGLLVVALIVAGVWLVGFSRYVTAERVEVSGVRTLTIAQVDEVARVPLGTPLARVDLRAIEGRIGALPQVASVAATRSWPHVVHVAVTERTPLYALKSALGYSLVDVTGTAYLPRAGAPAGLMVADLGPDPTQTLLADIGRVVVALPADLRSGGSLTAATRDSIQLVLPKATVIWGSADDTARKAEVLRALRKGAPGAAVYDVSAPAHPVVR